MTTDVTVEMFVAESAEQVMAILEAPEDCETKTMLKCINCRNLYELRGVPSFAWETVFCSEKCRDAYQSVTGVDEDAVDVLNSIPFINPFVRLGQAESDGKK